jgi:hypothetical protein
MTKARRLELQVELEGYFTDDPRVKNPEVHVSFQPPEGSTIKYPHIVYARDPAYKLQADNITYHLTDKYVVTYIDREPDSSVFDELEQRPHCSHRASFVEDGLNHSVFDLYH